MPIDVFIKISGPLCCIESKRIELRIKQNAVMVFHFCAQIDLSFFSFFFFGTKTKKE